MTSEENIQEKIDELQLKEELEQLQMREKIKEFLLQYYQPVKDPAHAELHFSSQSIYEQLQLLYPSANYSVTDVAAWMNAGGFYFFDFGEMRFEWLMKRA